ncbi:tripartite tricarboxylate transporter substrate binding protein [Xylophilus rhododendri]|uniref:Tripartite tricarboxylate transporter substrate binding protein n=1 Tax=Xylophilus rhododendri TaxID=2697032 RepID=A0A857IZ58_9BURK|nr:tripartite tricarboxylate transporter substrate binding protein [Xylophilus rhododendri]QHI96874.1 tripartite tricarboxylate transporter substrate binding protein [Xylophilus rhododendri]
MRDIPFSLARRGLLATAAAPLLARAAGYPDKPVRIIVPYVPGGGADILARYMAQMLTGALGQPVIVDNRAGAGGLIGVDVGLASPADGSVLTLISSSYTVNPSLYKLKFDPVRDITPIGQMSAGPLLVVVNPASPIRTIADLVAAAKARPGEISYASSGQGSALHLAAAQFARRAGVQMNHIPYKGGGAALTDVMSGQVDVYFAATASALPHVEGGRLRALAVTTTERIASLPQVPTIAQCGYPGYDVTLWYGLIGPKGLPAPIVQRINSEVGKILLLPATAEKFKADGAMPAGGTPAAFGQRIATEIAAWHETVTALKIKVE